MRKHDLQSISTAVVQVTFYHSTLANLDGDSQSSESRLLPDSWLANGCLASRGGGAGGAFGKLLLSEVHVGWDTILIISLALSSSRLLHSRQVVKGRKRLFIQSQGAEDRLHLRLEAVALDELPRLLPPIYRY